MNQRQCTASVLQGLLLAMWLLAAWLSPRPAAAAPVDPPLQINQYAHTSWTARDGATLGLVFGMAQTPDGYLWIAGSFGLFRFDGQRFMKWEPPDGQKLPSGPYSLLVSRDGTLWIGTFGGLSSWNGRQFVSRHPEVGNVFVTSLLEDRHGTVWVGVLAKPGRLCAIRGGHIQCSTAEGRFGGTVWSLAEDGAGNLWVGAESGVWRWSPGAPQHYPMPGLQVGDLATTGDGQVLVGIRHAGVKRFDGKQFVPYPMRDATRPETVLSDGDVKSNKLLRDRDGGLWIGTEGQGLIHAKDGRADRLSRSEGLSGNVACSLFEDREGNIWFGSERGVDRFSKLPVKTLTARQGLPHEIARSVLTTGDGSVWVATNDGLARWKDGGAVVYRERDGLPSAQVHSQYKDADGRLWVSTAKGLAYLAGNRFVRVPGVRSSSIHAITGDADGNLWLAGDQGLEHLHRGRPVDIVPWMTFGKPNPAQSVVAGRDGLWLSHWYGQVVHFRDGRIVATYSAEQGLGAGSVTSLRLEADGSVWATTGDGGLSRIKDGRITTFTVANGAPCNGMHWSALDRHGSLWMYAPCGLSRVSRDELAAWIADPGRRVKVQLWSVAEGVPLVIMPPAYFNPPVAQAPDGKLWMAGAVEVQVVDPDDMAANLVPPPVHIETLVADQKAYAVANGLRLPPLARDIRVEFSALTLVDPKSTRFRYRLEGHDTAWQEVVDRRLASYTNLPPGNYRFQVEAANNSGVWNEEGAELAFSIEPALYQKTWVRVTAVAVLLGLAWVAFRLWLRLRLRRMQRQFEATLEARVAERTRIARDLHDTLLQNFHGLLLQFQAACNLLPDRPRESRQILTGAIDHAAAAITEGRDTVQGLRASAAQADDLAQELRALAAELVREGGTTAVRVEVHGQARPLQPTAREEIARIAGEALRNAFRHARARRIDVEIRYEARRLRVTVSDDGQGIDADVLREGGKAGHFGLSGMRERAELAGGRLTVRSSRQEGTEVAFTAPGASVYVRQTPPSRLLQRLFQTGEVGQ